MAKSVRDTIIGTSKSDPYLQGSVLHDDLIYGYDGNDNPVGFNANDWLKGGPRR